MCNLDYINHHMTIGGHLSFLLRPQIKGWLPIHMETISSRTYNTHLEGTTHTHTHTQTSGHANMHLHRTIVYLWTEQMKDMMSICAENVS